MEEYKSLKIEQKKAASPVFYLYLNRPSHRNALSRDFFAEFPKALKSLDQNPNVSVIILAGAGQHFCSGIDLNTFSTIQTQTQSSDRGLSGERLRRDIKYMQAAVTALEDCRKPVIASIHGACIGGGIDIVTACDIRYSTEDAFFSVKEVDLAITADLGTLQRLPTIVGHGNAMELALTGRRFSASEAKQMGLVSRIFGSKVALDDFVALVAQGKLPSFLFFVTYHFQYEDIFQAPRCFLSLIALHTLEQAVLKNDLLVLKSNEMIICATKG